MLKRYSSSILLVICVIFLLLLFLMYQFGFDRDEAVHIDNRVHLTCPLQTQDCRFMLEGGALLFNLVPGGLPVLEPLALTVDLENIERQQLQHFRAWFEGRDMNMGQHELSMNESPKLNQISSVGMIPVCVVDQAMVWRLNIQFEYQNEMTGLTFDLVSALPM